MSSPQWRFADFRLDPDNACLWRGTQPIALTPKAFDVLHYLVTHPDRLVTKEDQGSVHIERWFDPSERSFNKRITIGEKRYLERVRGYDLDEISAMFSHSGLVIDSVFGDFTGAPYKPSSPRLILVGRRSPS